jgi:MFS family permease
LGISRIPSLFRLVLGSTVVLALANAVLVATDELYVGLAAAGLAGVTTAAGAIGTLTILQMTVAEHYRGRILSLYGMILRGSPAVGAILLGASADLLATREAILGGVAVVLAGAGRFHLKRERTRASWEAGNRERTDPR